MSPAAFALSEYGIEISTVRSVRDNAEDAATIANLDAILSADAGDDLDSDSLGRVIDVLAAFRA